MQLTDLNRAHDIGSNCLLIEMGPFRFVFDCGMHPKKVGAVSLPDVTKIADDSLDFIVITHSHLDHIGGLPVLARYKPSAPILVTPPSHVLVPRMLRNSVGVMLRQREELNLNELPLFTYGEIERLEGRLRAVAFGKPHTFQKKGQKLEITFFPAGHVAGAAGMRVVYGKERVFFTGDVLFSDQVTLTGARFPEEEFDTVVTETTRGARGRALGTSRDTEATRFIESIALTLGNSGTVLVPVFALGRMQEVLALIHAARRARKLPESMIFATGLGLDLVDHFDTLARSNPTIRFRRRIMQEMNVQPLRQKLGPGREPGQRGIYILSSGMMVENTPSYAFAAGMLAKPTNAIYFAGYCDPDTPGGKLLAAKPGDKFSFNALPHIATIRARVERFDLSAHAEREELLAYALARRPRTVVITHGDPPARAWFAEQFSRAPNAPRVVDPEPGQAIEV
jgi:Cft2 family RNA processing exonuclease